jgi:hypothetical protein
MRNRSLVAAGAGLAILTAGAASAGTPVPGALYASTGAIGGELITIDPATGDGTLVCNTGAYGPLSEIEFDDAGVLWGTTGGGTAALVTIDPDDCTETLIGNHPPGAVNALEFVGGVLYGAYFVPPGGAGGEEPEGSPTSLVIVDTTDGSLTEIGPMNASPVRGLAWHEATQTMYATGSPLQGADTLYTVNLTNGVATTVGLHDIQLGALEFGPDGVLYGGQRPGGGAAPAGSADFVSVSTVDGFATTIGQTGFSAVSGLSFAPEGEEPPVQAIPTLSTVALAMLAGLLLAVASLALRRSRSSR